MTRENTNFPLCQPRHKVKNIAGAVWLLAYSMATPVLAQLNPDDASRLPRMSDSAQSAEPYSIDPRNGNLTVRHRDLILPGNGGMNIEVWRYYNLNQVSAALYSTHNQSYRWAALGPGWELGVAPRLTAANSYFQAAASTPGQLSNWKNVRIRNAFIEFCAGRAIGGGTDFFTIQLELPNGDSQPVYSNGSGVGITPGNWKVTCIGNSISATAPDGTRYEYGSLSTDMRFGKTIAATPAFNPPFSNPSPMPTAAYVVAKTATDLNGNSFAYQYQQFGTAIPLPNPLDAYGPMPAGLSVPAVSPAAESPAYLLSSVTSNDGRSVSFSYDQTTGRLLSMADNAGRSWSYSYLAPDSNNSRTLSTVTMPTGMTWRYNYGTGAYLSTTNGNSYSPLNETTTSNRKITSIVYPTGGSVAFRYGYWADTQRVNIDLQKSGGERIIQKTLSTGEAWSYSYARGSAGQYDTTIISGPEGTTVHRYMGMDYSKSVDGDPNVYHNNAWRLGRLMQKTDPLGNTETYVWQARELYNRSIAVTELGTVRDQKLWLADLQQRTVTRDGATYVTTFSNFDAYGNPGTVVESGPNGGNRTTTNTYLNDMTKWIIGRPKDQVSEAGSVIRTFDANGNLESESLDGVLTSFTYDGQGNIATKNFPRDLLHAYSNYKRGTPQSESQPEGVFLTRIVDDAGNVVSSTNGEGKTTTYTFDGLNRMKSITPPSGNATSFAYTPNSKIATRGSLVETTQYDAFGRANLLSLGGVVTTFGFDAFGRKTFESNPGASIGTTYEYDALGRKKKVTNSDGSFRSYQFGPGTTVETDERGNSNTFAYRSYGDPTARHLVSISTPQSESNISIGRNAKDLVTSITQNGITRSYGYNENYYLTSVSNPETGMTVYGRDAAGNMITRSVGSSGTSTYVYDGQNRLKSTTYPGATPAATFEYTKINKMASATAGGSTRQFTYDANGNLSSETQSIDGSNFSVGYGYNGNDQLASLTYPVSGRVVNYSPDVLGRPTQVSGYVNSITYWPSGQLMQVNYANGTTSSYGQSTRLWPSNFAVQRAGSQYLNSQYQYDGSGNLTSITDSVDSALNRGLGYDVLHRLITANGPWGSGAITYDETGNLTSQVFGGHGLYYQYDYSNKLSSTTGVKAANYSYDSYGNMTSDGTNTFVYDGVPNLRCANCSAGSRVDYTYDAMNRRNSATTFGVRNFEITGSSGNLLVEYAPSAGNRLVEYFYIGNKRIAQQVTP